MALVLDAFSAYWSTGLLQLGSRTSRVFRVGSRTSRELVVKHAPYSVSLQRRTLIFLSILKTIFDGLNTRSNHGSDGAVAFTGSSNYTFASNLHREGSCQRLTGPCVAQIQEEILEAHNAGVSIDDV